MTNIEFTPQDTLPNAATMRDAGAANRCPTCCSASQLFSIYEIETAIDFVLSINPSDIRVSNWSDEWTIEHTSGLIIKAKTFDQACLFFVQAFPWTEDQRFII